MTMDLNEFLEKCQELESRLAQVYRTLAANENLNPETRALFTGLERNGKRFEDRLRKEWARLAVSEYMSCGYQPLSRELSLQVETVLKVVSEEEINDLRALRLVKSLETNFWDFYLKSALFYDQVELKTLFTDIAWEKRNHISLLQEHFMTSTGRVNSGRFPPSANSR